MSRATSPKTMSNVTSPKASSNERPDQDLEQAMSVDVAPSANPDISDDASEEGEINENLDEGLRQAMTVEVAPSANAESSRVGDEEGETQEDLPLGTKRKRSTSREEQPPPKRTKTDPVLTDCSFRRMSHPHKTIPCVVSVDQGTPFGTLYRANNSFAVMLFIDPGRFGAPAIRLGLRTHGTEHQKDHARIHWDMVNIHQGRWAMSRVGHGYCPLNGSDPRMSNAAVHALCRVGDIGQLLYMTFTSWDMMTGFTVNTEFKTQAKETRKSLNIMTNPQQSYQLELWFIAPFDAIDFRMRCLRFFTECEKVRVHPLHQWRDNRGDYFNDTLMLAAPRALADLGPKKQKFRLTAPARREQRKVPGDQDADAAQDEVPDIASSQVEQSTAELSLAAPHLEDSTSTAARDAKMLDRSPSPSKEIQQTPGRQTLRTVDTGHPLHPTQDPQTSASSAGLDSQPAAPNSLSIFDLGPDPVPAMFLNADSEPESTSDNGEEEANGEQEEDQA